MNSAGVFRQFRLTELAPGIDQPTYELRFDVETIGDIL